MNIQAKQTNYDNKGIINPHCENLFKAFPKPPHSSFPSMPLALAKACTGNVCSAMPLSWDVRNNHFLLLKCRAAF